MFKDKIAEIIDLYNNDGMTPNKAAEEVIKEILAVLPAEWQVLNYENPKEFGEVEGHNSCLADIRKAIGA